MKNRIIFSLIFFAAVAILLDSCAPAYIPNVINTPLMSEQGDFQVNVNSAISGFDPQVAYAATDHLGFMANGSFANRTSDTTDNFHKHHFIEFGSGYFTTIGTSGRFETFGGVGFGKVRAEYDNDIWQSRTDVNNLRIYIQPSIGASSEYLDGSISTRFVLVNLYQGADNNTGFFAEPVLTGKVGFPYLKAVFQMGVSIPVNATSLDFNYQPFLFSVGLQANIGEFFK